MGTESELLIVARVAVAAILGAIVGLEREIKGKPAGLRTHLLVCAASCLLIGLGEVMIHRFQDFQPVQILRTDPIRIIEAIATGISFIGAGTIIFDRSANKLEGITTAASILTTAGIGIAVGLEAYWVAAITAVMLAAVLFGLGWLEWRLGWKDDEPNAGEHGGHIAS